MSQIYLMFQFKFFDRINFNYKVSFLMVFLLCFQSCKHNQEDVPTEWADFVDFQKGNFPLLITAVHGGDLRPQWIEDRDCEGAKVVQDQYTLGIAIQIAEELNKHGLQPYMLLTKIHRVKIDLNRSLETSHCDDDTSNDLWRLFHNKIEAFREEVIEKYGRGLLIDIHGHGHPIQRIELGYLLSSQQLRTIAEDLSPEQNYTTSINSLIENHPANQNLNNLIFGEQALGTLLATRGFPTVPSSQDRAPNQGDPFFSGGTNTKLYGSNTRNGVDAIQIELNQQRLRFESQDRALFAQTFAGILIDYMSFHYSEVFTH